MAYQVVLFDIDGTLLDFARAEHHALEAPEEPRPCHVISELSQVVSLCLSPSEGEGRL